MYLHRLTKGGCIVVVVYVFGVFFGVNKPNIKAASGDGFSSSSSEVESGGRISCSLPTVVVEMVGELSVLVVVVDVVGMISINLEIFIWVVVVDDVVLSGTRLIISCSLFVRVVVVAVVASCTPKSSKIGLVVVDWVVVGVVVEVDVVVVGATVVVVVVVVEVDVVEDGAAVVVVVVVVGIDDL